MTSNWLHDYLRDATRRNLCTEIYCSTCGAMEFRHGVFLALERATGQDAGRPASREAVLTIIRTLARIVPAETEAMDFEPAVRCLLFDACSGLPILDREIEDLLADS